MQALSYFRTISVTTVVIPIAIYWRHEQSRPGSLTIPPGWSTFLDAILARADQGLGWEQAWNIFHIEHHDLCSKRATPLYVQGYACSKIDVRNEVFMEQSTSSQSATHRSIAEASCYADNNDLMLQTSHVIYRRWYNDPFRGAEKESLNQDYKFSIIHTTFAQLCEKRIFVVASGMSLHESFSVGFICRRKASINNKPRR